ncbi:hypothetical protein Lal_00044802 [Lupinus albus]|nr:hypothetical protein Lal_00044802 [Lupinus albus]
MDVRSSPILSSTLNPFLNRSSSLRIDCPLIINQTKTNNNTNNNNNNKGGKLTDQPISTPSTFLQTQFSFFLLVGKLVPHRLLVVSEIV